MRLPKIPGLFKGDSSQEYLAIDLGSLVVRVMVFRPATELSDRRVLGTGRQVQGVSSMYGGVIRDFDAVLEAVSLALESAHLRAGVTPNRAIFGLSGGAIIVKGLRVRTQRKDPDTKLTEEEFQLLAEHIETKTLERARQEVKADQRNLQRVGTSFTAYLMDGAYVETPLALTGENLEIAVLHYFITPEMLRMINSLADELGLEVVSLVDTAVQVAVSHQDKRAEFVLVDVGGGVTEVVVVRNGKVLGNEVVFVGDKGITQRIQEVTEGSFEQAEEMKHSYLKGHLDQERARTVRRAVEEVSQLVVEGVAEALRLFNLSEIPPRLVIAGSGRDIKSLRSAMASFPWNKELSFSTFPRIDILEGKDPNLKSLTEVEI